MSTTSDEAIYEIIKSYSNRVQVIKQKGNTYLKLETIYPQKPVMLKYIAEKNGYAVEYIKNSNCIYIIKDKKRIKKVVQFYSYNGRAFVSSDLFKNNFKGMYNTTHLYDDLYDTSYDAELALASISYNQSIWDMEPLYTIDMVGEKYRLKKWSIFDITKIPKDIPRYQIGSNNIIYKLHNGTTTVLEHNMAEIMKKAEKAYCSQNFVKTRDVYFHSPVKGVLNGSEIELKPTENWASRGLYENIKHLKDKYGRYIVAVGPRILNPDYPDNGRIRREEFDYESYIIEVYLENIETKEQAIIYCVIEDIKAHSYNKYPDGHKNSSMGTASFNVENGIMQTGIAYPNSSNASKNMALAVSPKGEDSSVIEFCSIEELDFHPEKFCLIKLKVYEYIN